MASTLDTDAIARRLNAARLSLEGRSREANAFAPSDAETYAVYAVQEYVGDIAALLAEVATLRVSVKELRGFAKHRLTCAIGKMEFAPPKHWPDPATLESCNLPCDCGLALAVSRLTEEPK